MWLDSSIRTLRQYPDLVQLLDHSLSVAYGQAEEQA